MQLELFEEYYYDGTKNPVSMCQQFDEGADITQRRGSAYAHPLDDFNRIELLKQPLQDCGDPEVRHALEMIAVKMSRLCVCPPSNPAYIDSLIDISGYARTIAMINDERGKRNNEST